MTRSIDIEIAPPEAVQFLPDLLLNYGWRHAEEKIHVFLQDDINEPSELKTYPIDEWPNIRHLIQTRIHDGLPIGIGLSWSNPGAFMEMRLTSQGCITFFPGDASPTVADSGGFTDYSWFLERILPAIAAKMTILKVTCDDDAY